MPRDNQAIGWLLRQAPARHLSVLVSTAIAGSILTIVTAPITGYAFDLVREQGSGTVIAAGALMASLLLRAVVVGFRQNASIRLGSTLESSLRDRLIERLIGQPTAIRAANQSLGVMTGDTRAIRFLAFPGLDLMFSSVAMLAMTVVACAFYGPLALAAPALYAVVYTVVCARYVRTLTTSAGDLRGSAADLTAVLEETLDGLEAVRDSHLSDAIWNKVRQAATQHRDLSVRQGWAERRAPLFLLLGVAQATGFAVAITQLRAGALSLGGVVGYVGLLMMLGVPTFSAYAAYPRIAGGLAAAQRIRTALSAGERDEAMPGHPAPLEAVSPASDGNGVRFAGVEFGYPLTGPIIRQASFTIPATGLTVVTGAVGSGKTSLARLMTGALQPSSGTITIDGVAVQEWDSAELVRQVMMIDESPALFSVSIEDNIRLGRDDLSLADITDAAKRSCADQFIEELPGGYRTKIGTGGVQLSGGERQRLALTRSLVSDAKALVLDDPLSGLDPDTARLLEEQLMELARTRAVIVVTDRPSLLSAATLVLHVGPAEVTATQGGRGSA